MEDDRKDAREDGRKDEREDGRMKGRDGVDVCRHQTRGRLLANMMSMALCSQKAGSKNRKLIRDA